MGSVRSVNRGLTMRRAIIMASPFSTRVSNPPYHPPQAGPNVVGSSTSTAKTHDSNIEDAASSRKNIKKSLGNDDGRDYGEGEKTGEEGDLSGFMAEKARKGARKSTETAFNAASAVAEGMEQTWGAVKETTEKVKDAMLGDEHERAQNYHRNDKAAEDRLRKDGNGNDNAEDRI